MSNDPSFADESSRRVSAPVQKDSSPPATNPEKDTQTIQVNTDIYVMPQSPAPIREDAPSLNHHELFERLGRGGMGVVFRARDTVLDRPVALKMIRSGELATGDEVERFYREARAAARLHHRHIVAIHGIGLHQGQHCYTMDLVTGGSLAQHLDRFRDDPRSAVALMEKVARAVQAAHDQGVIHRDLKPGNILLDHDGEPMVSDFGLAKLSGNEVELTAAGQPIGTPAYMAPEQATGGSSRVTPHCDTWALGVILYELLVGQRPFAASSSQEVTRQILSDDPPPPRRLRHDLPRDLQTIVLKCLEKEPTKRYRSAAALADDLAHWLHREPIAARAPRWPRRSWRWLRRHPWVIAAMVLAALPVAALFVHRHITDPDRALRDIDRRLVKGEAVTLIGETGAPLSSRWQTPKQSSGGLSASNNLFVLSSLNQGLLELHPHVPLECYRFRAQVRHEHSIDLPRNVSLGSVGIYIAHFKYEADKGVEHCFWELSFDDLVAVTRPRGQPVGNEVALIGRRYRPWDTVPGLSFGINPGGMQHFFAPDLPLPNALPQRWRELALEVTPQEIRGFWDGASLGTLSREHLLKATNDILTDPKEPVVVPAGSFPGTALGLYVRRSTAAFRNVVIEPLEN